MTKSKTETKSKTKIIFEKLTVEDEIKVRGGTPPQPIGCKVNPPSLMDC